MDNPLDWGRWFAVALPVSAVQILLIWGLLLSSYRPSKAPDGESEIEIRPIRATREAFTVKQYWVSFVCLCTIALWCIAHEIEDYVGDMGVIAIIPILAFFSTGVLKKVSVEPLSGFRRFVEYAIVGAYADVTLTFCIQDDFEQFTWTIVFLAMGGIALGKGVTSSGLLDVMGEVIRDMVDGYKLYNVVLILSPIVLVGNFAQLGAVAYLESAGHIHVHQSYNCKRPSCSNCERSWQRSWWKSPGYANLHYWIDLLDWDGYASFWLSKPNSVSPIFSPANSRACVIC